MTDPVDHPQHYNAHPSGIEAITLCEMLSFNLGNALKYLMRADHKGKRAEDRAKAAWYLRREAARPRRAWTDMSGSAVFAAFRRGGRRQPGPILDRYGQDSGQKHRPLSFAPCALWPQRSY